ncbi:MAG: division/cell wall cluster transcriptional repressor MraZ [Candidatus Saccharicenans sp.]
MGKVTANRLLIGSYTARLDGSGRLKIPEKFRDIIEQSYGQDVFITSLTDEAVQIYPLAVWEQMTSMANEGALNLRPDVRRFLLRVNLKGSHHQIDAKGRVLISQSLREKARLNTEVEVIGLNNHLEIWNKEVLESVIEKRPLSEEDFENIARLVPRGKTE